MSPRRLGRYGYTHTTVLLGGGGGEETYGPRPTPKGHAYMSFRWVLPLTAYQQVHGRRQLLKSVEAHPLTDGTSMLAKFSDCRL